MTIDPASRALEEDWTRSPARPIAAIVLLALLAGGFLVGWAEGRAPIDARPATDITPVAILIDVNSASPAQLDLLPGIGPARADAIIHERTAFGPFRSLDDLQRVRGIGPRTVEKLRALATAGPTD